MTRDEIDALALGLDRKARTELAIRLVASLEMLTQDERDVLFTEEIARRKAGWSGTSIAGRSVEEILRDLAAKLR